jgi:hypothetical protein
MPRRSDGALASLARAQSRRRACRRGAATGRGPRRRFRGGTRRRGLVRAPLSERPGTAEWRLNRGASCAAESGSAGPCVDPSGRVRT